MVEILQVVRLDIEASITAFKENDFENMNIFANRAMANAIFSDDKKLVLPGFFMKELVGIFGTLEARKGREQPPFSTAKAIGVDYVDSLSKLLSEENLDEGRLWQEFHKVNVELRKFIMNPFEEKLYKEDISFTRHAFEWLVKYLENEKFTLLNPRNQLLKGILNEMDRIFTVHSGALLDVHELLLIRALDRYYDYCRIAYRKPDGTLDENKITQIVFPYIQKIHDVSSSPTNNQTAIVDETLSELVKGWREFFIQYMELPRPRIEIERGVELPEEAKRKITESVTKSLEKEIGFKKPRAEK